MGRPGNYLFKREGSQFWWVRFQYTGKLKEKFGPKLEFSLGTTEREEAELLAAGHIFEHKARLLLQRSHGRTPLITKLNAGLLFKPNEIHTDRDGRRLYATNDYLVYIDGDDAGTKKPNVSSEFTTAFTEREVKEVIKWLPKDEKPTDDDIIADWVKIRNISRHLQKEAYDAWATFRQITNRKPLRQCKRADGRKLVEALYATGNKSGTVAKKIAHLRAAVNLAIADDKLEYNPFENILDKRNDRLKRDPLEDGDMILARSRLGALSANDRLLWKFLAFTGMRLSEPFQINREHTKNGIRCFEVGTKTETSRRFVPIPTALLSEIPRDIKGPLFLGSPKMAGKRLRRFLRILDIAHDSKRQTGSPSKVIHSLRHRAKDRLRDLGCPLDIQYAILGHEKKTVAASYGHGYPMKELLRWIDKIGY